MMQAILDEAAADLGVSDITVESAGVNESSAGQPIAEFSALELRNRGLNLDGHVSRFAGSLEDVETITHVIAVGEKEADALRELHPVLADRITILEIPNPWQQGPEAYAKCALAIDALMREFAADKLLGR
jgi:protein-tyrosine-phosphatase